VRGSLIPTACRGPGIASGSPAQSARASAEQPGRRGRDLCRFRGLATAAADVILGTGTASDDLESLVRLARDMREAARKPSFERLELPTRLCVLSDTSAGTSAPRIRGWTWAFGGRNQSKSALRESSDSTSRHAISRAALRRSLLRDRPGIGGHQRAARASTWDTGNRVPMAWRRARQAHRTG